MNKKYFLIGIKGSGMTPLATLLSKRGAYVTGSDVEETVFTEEFLKASNIKIHSFNEYDFDKDYIVIVGNSFKQDFSEVEKAKKQGNKIYYYYEFLGLLSKSEFSIAVTGTHGKTTTTTMLKNVFELEKNITYLVGDGRGSSCDDSDLFLFEACEYRNHFYEYYPNYAIITNVDLDHTDFFTSQEMYDNAFKMFGENVKEKLVVCGDDTRAYNIYKDNSKAVFYGFSDLCDYRITNVSCGVFGSKFDIVVGEEVFNFDVAIYGEHNVLNFASTIACAHLYGLNIQEINLKYKNSSTPKRRFEEYIYEEQVVIDDYAHHPDELKAFLDAVFQKYPNKHTVAVFEPHTVSRLQKHYKEFAKQLNRCDEQIVMKVEVPLRDKQTYGENHLESDIMLDLLDNGIFHPDNLYDYLQNKRDCVVLIIGATASKYTDKYINKINLIFNKK